MKYKIIALALGLFTAMQPFIWFVIYRALYDWGKIVGTGLELGCTLSAFFMAIFFGIITAIIVETKILKK